MRNTNSLYRGRGEPGTASDKQKDPKKKKNKPHKYRHHTRGQRGRETGRRATTEGRGGGGEDHEGFWPGARLKVLCGDLWGTSLRATSGRSSTIVLQREAISPRLIRTASRPPSVITVRLRQVLSGVLLFEADVAEPFEHAQFFEDLLRGQRRHEREEFPPAAVRGELQETQEFRVRALHAISAEGVGQGKGRQEGHLLAREFRHVTHRAASAWACTEISMHL
jgi:hypothetical protein